MQFKNIFLIVQHKKKKNKKKLVTYIKASNQPKQKESILIV